MYTEIGLTCNVCDFLYCKISGLSPLLLGFHPISVHMKFLVYKWPWDRFCPSISVLPCQFHSTCVPCSSSRVALARRTNGRSWEPATEQCFLGNRRELHRNVFVRHSSSVR